jgi:calcineurin-like phosphoesterase family protein
MNNTIVTRHNERVKENDTVFVLGDFKFGKGTNAHEYQKMMNGKLVFIRGNHDKNNGVNTIMEHALIKSFGLRILLIHRPIDIAEVRDPFDLALVGHVHHHWKFSKNNFNQTMINVGVDVWDFYPVHLKQILKAYKMWQEEP